MIEERYLYIIGVSRLMRVSLGETHWQQWFIPTIATMILDLAEY